jgi:hydroxymethylpyrimidine/phosphomethylpyrimidine kinase
VSQRVETKNTHGTGCTFSAAIAANVAKGLPVSESVRIAKDYLTTVIQSADALSVGKGHGPLHHFSSMWNLSFPI